MQVIKDERRDPTEPTTHPEAGPSPARCLWSSPCTPASSGRGDLLLVEFYPSFPLVLLLPRIRGPHLRTLELCLL